MKGSNWWVRAWLVLSLLLIAAPTLRGADDEAEPAAKKTKADGETKASKQGLPGYYGAIAKAAEISDAQREQMIAVVGERATAVKQWNAEHGAKLTELETALETAEKDENTDAAKQLKAQVKELEASRKKILDASREKIMAVFTPEQKAKVAGYNLYVGAMTRYSRYELTQEQKDKARTICMENGQAALEADGNKEAEAKLKTELSSRIEKEVLTDAQRAKVGAPRPKADAKDKEKDEAKESAEDAAPATPKS